MVLHGGGCRGDRRYSGTSRGEAHYTVGRIIITRAARGLQGRAGRPMSARHRGSGGTGRPVEGIRLMSDTLGTAGPAPPYPRRRHRPRAPDAAGGSAGFHGGRSRWHHRTDADALISLTMNIAAVNASSRPGGARFGRSGRADDPSQHGLISPEWHRALLTRWRPALRWLISPWSLT